uniref:Tetrahydrofolate dehydrogenase/cyclohydrolase catalytic domain-containing protein n=1 Tax=Panthera leo TaxID=9689 RepID=A0A8C8WP88_PANLE
MSKLFQIYNKLEERTAQGNKQTHLSVVLVGENPASPSYIHNRTRAAARVGINSETIVKPASISEEELLNLINKLNNDGSVDGLLIQLLLPESLTAKFKLVGDVDFEGVRKKASLCRCWFHDNGDANEEYHYCHKKKKKVGRFEEQEVLKAKGCRVAT